MSRARKSAVGYAATTDVAGGASPSPTDEMDVLGWVADERADLPIFNFQLSIFNSQLSTYFYFLRYCDIDKAFYFAFDDGAVGIKLALGRAAEQLRVG